MNSNIKSTIIFLAGAAVGSVVSWLLVKKYYEDKADSEVEEIRRAYDKHLEDLGYIKTSVDGEIEGDKEISEPEPGVKPTRSSLVEKLNNKPPLTDYSKYFKEKGGEDLKLKEVVRDASKDVDPAELEHPEDDEPYTDEEDRDQTLDFEDHQLNGEHRKAMMEGRLPYIIEPSDYELTCSNYEKLSLLYYISDDILCEEEDGEEVSRLDVVGSCIRDSGFDENEEELLFVRNDRLMCDYEINKVFTNYEKG